MANQPVGSRSQAVQLGAELREQRQRAGMTVVQVGEALGFHHSTISRWERGESMPDESDTGAALAIYGVRGQERNRLVELARLNAVPDWVAPYGPGQLAPLMDWERRAERIVHVHPCLVPGLLQTRAYARSLMISGGMPADKADDRTDVRIGRQRVLTGRQPVTLVAVIGEMALRYPPCGADVMIEQLRHLLAMGARPNVEIHVVPLEPGSYNFALDGEFVLFELQRDNPVVQVTACRSAIMLTKACTVDRYREVADIIVTASLDTDASSRCIAGIADDLAARQTI